MITLYFDPEDIRDGGSILTESELEDNYRDMLDTHDPIIIGDAEYDYSRVLELVDPVAFRTGFSDYSSEWSEMEVPLDIYLMDSKYADEYVREYIVKRLGDTGTL